jgi:tetratricopeptide (TPR) repeat protein
MADVGKREGRARVAVVVLVALVALAARVRLVVATRGLPQFEVPVLDSRYYLTTGAAWAAGTPPPARPFFMSPGYTAFVAACARVATSIGSAPTPAAVVVALQVAADVLAAALLAVLATRWFGVGPGLVAGLLFALLWPQIVFTTRVLDATLGSALVALLMVALAALDGRPSGPKLVGNGLLVGLLMTLRATPFAFVAAELALLAWRGRSDGALRVARRAAWFLLGVALPIAPVAWRNFHVGGEAVLLTSSFGVNFFIGNAAGTDGRFMSLNQMALAPGRFDDDPTDGRFERSAAAFAQERSGRRLGAGEVSAFWSGLAWKEIGAAPWTAAFRYLRKLGLFVDAFETPQVDNVYFLARYAPPSLAWLAHGSRLFWPLAWFGLLLLPGRMRELPVASLLAFVATYAAAIALFFVTDRYRLWITPIAALGVAAGIDALVRAWRVPGPGAWGRSALLVACVVVCNLNPALGLPPDVAAESPPAPASSWFGVDDDWYDFARQHNNMAARCLEVGDAERALEEAQAGLALRPDLGALHLNRAAAYVARAKMEERAAALRSVDAALADLRHPSARGSGIGGVLCDALELRFDLGADDLATDRELAPLLYQRGEFAAAVHVATRWCELAPDDPEAWNTKGGALLRAGRSDDGIAALRTAVAKAPDVVKYSYNLGVAELKDGRFEVAAATLAPLVKASGGEGAIAPYAEALAGAGRRSEARAVLAPLIEKQPDHLGALLTLGEIELAEGHRDAARRLATRALAKNPSSERARKLRRDVGD